MASRAAARALSSASASATAAAAAAVSLGSSNCLLDLHLFHIASFYPSSLIYTLSVYIKTTLLAYFHRLPRETKIIFDPERLIPIGTRRFFSSKLLEIFLETFYQKIRR